MHFGVIFFKKVLNQNCEKFYKIYSKISLENHEFFPSMEESCKSCYTIFPWNIQISIIECTGVFILVIFDFEKLVFNFLVDNMRTCTCILCFSLTLHSWIGFPLLQTIVVTPSTLTWILSKFWNVQWKTQREQYFSINFWNLRFLEIHVVKIVYAWICEVCNWIQLHVICNVKMIDHKWSEYISEEIFRIP